MPPESAAIQTRTSLEKPVCDTGLSRPFLLLLLGLIFACYFRMLRITAEFIWFGEDMAHGLFAPMVALYLVWHDRDALLRPSSSPSSWALPILAFSAFLDIAATLASSSTFSRFALLMSLAACLLLIGGWQVFRRFTFPLALLLFTFPIPAVLYGEITQPLQFLATRLSEATFELLGFSVIREGNILQLTHMRLSVVEACSGIRSLVTLSFFCLVYSRFFEDKLWLRACITLLAVPAAILVNMLRISTTVILGKYNLAWTTGVYHESLGWAGFFVGFLLIFLAHQTLRRLGAKRSAI